MLKSRASNLSSSWVVDRQQGAAYTGGPISLTSDGRVALCMCSERIALLDLQHGTVVKWIPPEVPGVEAEPITAFAAAATGGLLVSCSRNLMFRVWSLPDALCIRSWKAAAVHRSPVACTDMEPTGTLLATGGTDRAVFVWDVEKGHATHSFKGHDALVTVVKFLPSAHGPVQRLASGAENGQLRIWDLITGACIAAVSEHFSSITGIAVSPDAAGYTLLTVARDKLLNVWDTRDFDAANLGEDGEGSPSAGGPGSSPLAPRAQVTLMETAEAVVALPRAGDAAVPESGGGAGKGAGGLPASSFEFLTGGDKGVVRKWSLSITGATKAARKYACRLAGATTVTRLRDQSSNFGEEEEGEEGSRAAAGAASPSAAAAAAASLVAAALQAQSEPPLSRQICGLLVVPRGSGLSQPPRPAGSTTHAVDSSSTSAGGAKKGKKRRRQEEEEAAGGTASAGGDAASGSPALVLMVTRDQVLTLLHAEDGALGHVRTLPGYNDDVVDVRYIPRPLPSGSSPGDPEHLLHPTHRRTLLAVATNSEQLRIVDADTFATSLLDGHTDIVLSVCPSPDGTLIATASKDHTARVWDVATGTCLAVCEGHTESVTGVAWPARAERFLHATGGGGSGGAPRVEGTHGWLLSCSKDRTLKAWDLGQLLRSLPSPRPRAPHWTRAAASAAAAAAPTPRTSAAIVAHDKDVNAVAVAPNDRLVATCSQDKTIRLWSLPSLAPVATLKGHKRGVWNVAFSSADQLLASASGDRTIRLWGVSPASGYACLRTLEGHDASVLCVRFLRGGSQLVSSGADGLLKLWNVLGAGGGAAAGAEGEGGCVGTFDGHTAKVWAVDVRPAAGAGAPAPTATLASDSGAPPPPPAVEDELVTGGGDSLLVVWRDATAAEAHQGVEALERGMQRTQELYSAMAKRDYPAAVALTLELDHPGRCGDILRELLESGPLPATAGLTPQQLDLKARGSILAEIRAMDATRDATSVSSSSTASGSDSAAAAAPHGGVASCTALLLALSPVHLGRLLRYLREWNAESKHGLLAQNLLCLLLGCVTRERLLDALVVVKAEEAAAKVIPGIGSVAGAAAPPAGGASSAAAGGAPQQQHASRRAAAVAELRALVSALLPYSERHFERIDRLGVAAYIVDFTLGAMQVLPPERVAAAAAEAAARRSSGLRRAPSSQQAAATADGSDEEGEEEEDAQRSAGWLSGLPARPALPSPPAAAPSLSVPSRAAKPAPSSSRAAAATVSSASDSEDDSDEDSEEGKGGGYSGAGAVVAASLPLAAAPVVVKGGARGAKKTAAAPQQVQRASSSGSGSGGKGGGGAPAKGGKARYFLGSGGAEKETAIEQEHEDGAVLSLL